MQGHVRKRSTWEFIVDVGSHPLTGRRRQKSKSGFAMKRAAESALHEFILFIEGGGDPSPERIRLAGHLMRWLEYQRTRGVRPRTLQAYEGYVRREILPVIGDLELARIKPATSEPSSPGCKSEDSQQPPSPRSPVCWGPPCGRQSPTGWFR